MTLTASDVVSLKSALGWWEVAEYVSTGIVFIGCVGEFFAEFTPFPSSDHRKHKLARLSLILVIAGIAGELLATVKASELSGQIIAYVEANASDAKTSAAGAANAASEAQVAAINAKREADGAQSLARGARKEADSFEKDIVAAKTQAAAAESHLAAALQRAANADKEALAAQRELDEYKAPRTLNVGQQLRIIGKLNPFPGTPYELAINPTPEAIGFLPTIDSILKAANWVKHPPSARYGPVQMNFTLSTGELLGLAFEAGIMIDMSPKDSTKYGAVIKSAVLALRAEGLKSQGRIIKDFPEGNVRVIIGSKQ